MLHVIGELLTIPPLALTPDTVKSLHITAHTMHGTLCDWMTTIGEWPTVLADVASPGCGDYELGFSPPEIDATGNWLSRDATESDAKAAPPPKGGKKPSRAKQEMRDRYSSGEGREGLRARQLRTRRRAFAFVRRALMAWQLHWGVSWLRMPPGHESKRILAEHPSLLRPVWA